MNSLCVVFGDSITEGNELPPADRPRAWVNLVHTRSCGRLRMVNHGKGGRPTGSLAEFDHILTLEPRADILVIALGTNDSRNIGADCISAAVANIRAIITRARQAWGPQLTILLLAPPNIRKDTLGPTRPIADQRDAQLRHLGAAYKILAEELGCHFLSLYGILPADSLAKDGVHPDVTGNEALATALLPKLLSLVK